MFFIEPRICKTGKRFQQKKDTWLLFLLISGMTLTVLLYIYLDYKSVYYDIAIINAVVHDGTKNGKSFAGGLGVIGSKIVKVWKGRTWIKPSAGLIIDAKKSDISSGFIDTHSHADLSIIDTSGNIEADNFVEQGITTIICGNCGRSPIDIQGFAHSIRKRKSNINIATLIGLNSVRKKVMQETDQAANASQIEEMRELVATGMKEGALGVSTGLAYPPGIFASRAEMVTQLKVAGEFGGIHATHMRNEGKDITKAVDEVIGLSREAEIPLLISHYKVTGLSNCGLFDTLQNRVNSARQSGMKIYLDYYPYDASSTNLNIFLPDWYLAIDKKAKARILVPSADRERLKKSIRKIISQEGFSDFRFAAVSYYAPCREWQGKTLDVIGCIKKKPMTDINSQLDVFLDMEKHGGAQMIYHNICQDVMDRIPQEEENMVGTDSAIRDENEEYLPHPRGWGAFPKFIRYFVNERKWLSLDEAIYRMTVLPATVFNLQKRGKIAKNFFADLVIFDAKSISDGATYAAPFKPPVGIKYVLVNGKVVINNEKADQSAMPLDGFPGIFIKKGAL